MRDLSRLRGCIPALVTPFQAGDLSRIDETALARLVQRAIRGGVSALVLGGSTGEGPALSAAEQARLLGCARIAGGALPLIAGIGAPNTEAACALAASAARLGADALLASAPPYSRPGQEGLQAHIRAIAAAAPGLPILLYDVPGRAAVAFTDDSIARLREAGLIHGLKDASGDLSRQPRLAALCGADFPQFSGDDATALAHRAMGGVGCVSVTANLLPGLCSRLQSAWDQGDLHSAARLRDLLAPLDRVLFCESNPVPVKAALGLLGLCDPTPRLPLTPASDLTKQILKAALITEEEDRYLAA